MKTNKVFRMTEVENVLVVELAGVVSSLADDSITRELDAVRERLRQGKFKAIIVDLGQVAYFGSSMLEAIRGMWNDLVPSHGRLILCNASEIAREILQIAKFDHLWPLVETRDEAMTALKV